MKNQLRAKLTIHGLPDLNPIQLEKLAMWIIDQAVKIKNNNKKYSKTYTAKFIK